MTDDHRTALDRALKDVGSIRTAGLATQIAGGTAGKIMQESLAASAIASQLGNRPNFSIGAALAEMQTRVHGGDKPGQWIVGGVPMRAV